MKQTLPWRHGRCRIGAVNSKETIEMNYRPLGQSGINASIVGLGTWAIGGGPWWGPTDDNESIRAIHAALDAGVNLIDTAPIYGFGHSEEVVGRAIKGRRDKVVLATKCGQWWLDARHGKPFYEYDGRQIRRTLHPEAIRTEIEGSLRRLKTDYIDLYQAHWPEIPPVETPVADSVACFMKLKQEGKIRAFGVSNCTLGELQEFCAAGPVASDQLRYSMLSREAEKEILPFCQKNGIATLTYMSLEQGLLTGKIGMDRVFKKEEFRSNEAWNKWYLLENRRRVLDLLDGWQDLTNAYRCSLAQLVVAWTAAQTGVTHVLCGARHPQQIQETARAADLTLDAATLQRMRTDVEALG